MTDKVQNIPQKKIVPRRPKMLFNGSVSQHPTSHEPMYGLPSTVPGLHANRKKIWGNEIGVS